MELIKLKHRNNQNKYKNNLWKIQVNVTKNKETKY